MTYPRTSMTVSAPVVQPSAAALSIPRCERPVGIVDRSSLYERHRVRSQGDVLSGPAARIVASGARDALAMLGTITSWYGFPPVYADDLHFLQRSVL
jgi:hypothetical protein